MAKNRSWFLWRGVAAVMLLVTLAGGGFAVYRLGWSQGYAAAELPALGDEASTPVLTPPGWRGGGLASGEALIAVCLGLLLLAFAGRLVCVIVWGLMAGPAVRRPAMAGGWGHPWHYWHRPWYHRPGCSMPAGDDQADAGA